MRPRPPLHVGTDAAAKAGAGRAVQDRDARRGREYPAVCGAHLAPRRGGRSRPSALAAMGAVEDGVRPAPLRDRFAPGVASESGGSAPRERCGGRSRRSPRHAARAARERRGGRSRRGPRRAARAAAECGGRVAGRRSRRGPRRAARAAARRHRRAPRDPGGAGRRWCRGRGATSTTCSEAHRAPCGARGATSTPGYEAHRAPCGARADRSCPRQAKMHGRRETGTRLPRALSPWRLRREDWEFGNGEDEREEGFGWGGGLGVGSTFAGAAANESGISFGPTSGVRCSRVRVFGPTSGVRVCEFPFAGPEGAVGVVQAT